MYFGLMFVKCLGGKNCVFNYFRLVRPRNTILSGHQSQAVKSFPYVGCTHLLTVPEPVGSMWVGRSAILLWQGCTGGAGVGCTLQC